MTRVDLRKLVGRLGSASRASIEAAAGLTLARTNYDVEVEHVLLKLLEDDTSDFSLIIKEYDVDRGALVRDLTSAIDRLRTGNARTPSLSPSLVGLIEDALLIGSVEHDATEIRTGHLLLAVLNDPQLKRLLQDTTDAFSGISIDDLSQRFGSITARSSETTIAPARRVPALSAKRDLTSSFVRPTQ